MARIRLITRADDLGAQHSANRAIKETYDTGICKNAGIMACTPHAKDAAELLSAEKGLCIGLHCTITSEWDTLRWGPVLPPTEISSIVQEDGTFYRTIPDIRERSPDPAHIVRELDAQYERARSLGFDLRYADFHMGGSRLLDELLGEGTFHQWATDKGLVDGVGAWQRVRLDPDDKADLDPVEQLIAALDAAEPGTWLTIGHPAYNDDEMFHIGSARTPKGKVGQDRDWQRLRFCDPRIVAYCRDHDVEPVRYDEA